jgi:hypothetical protein
LFLLSVQKYAPQDAQVEGHGYYWGAFICILLNIYIIPEIFQTKVADFHASYILDMAFLNMKQFLEEW